MSLQGGTLLDTAADDEPLDAARVAAEEAASRAGVRISTPAELDELRRAADVWQRVWRTEGEPPVSGEMLRALTHAGNYLSAAEVDGEVAGALMGFFGSGHAGNGLHGVDHMHSHILGVDPRWQGHGVGYALKLHQRAWALARGVARMTWTYDPLVRRNGHLNLAKLGARGVEYLVDFYGPMPDAINGGDHTDRILVEWDLAASALQPAAPALLVADWRGRGAVVALSASASGHPLLHDVAATAPLVLCATPPDIVAMRRSDPACAHEWRMSLRAVMVGAMSRGLRLVSMAAEGWYVLGGDEFQPAVPSART
jgi:predicted GNAT superfamily acetyltransferase